METSVGLHHPSPPQSREVTLHVHGEPSRRGKLWILNLGAKDLNSKCEPVSAEQWALSVTVGLPVVV